jgi:1,4-dihydroxy-2-naphthoate polyprenyltransferase
VKHLLRVARLPFLVVGLLIYGLGALWAIQAGGRFSFPALVLGYLVVLPSQLSVHFSNDYFDIGSDVRGHGTLISGGGGVLQDHPELRKPVKWIAVGLIIMSLAMSGIFLCVKHLPAWLFALPVVGNLIGWFYSAPPLRLAQRGVGEFCFPLLAGFLVPLLGYLSLEGSLEQGALYFLAPLLLYTLTSVVAVEIPDREADQLGNKRNWVVRMGRPAAFTIIGSLLLAATGYFFLSPSFYPLSGPFQPQVVGIITLVPLCAGSAGLILRPREQKPATRLAIGIVVSLSVFAFLVDGYLTWLAIR